MVDHVIYRLDVAWAKQIVQKSKDMELMLINTTIIIFDELQVCSARVVPPSELFKGFSVRNDLVAYAIVCDVYG